MTVQSIMSPDGTELVVLPRSQFDVLVVAAERHVQVQDTLNVARKPDGGGMIPDEVMELMMGSRSAVSAWRTYRRMSTTELAARTGLSRDDVFNIERDGNGPVSRETVRKLARILVAPEGALSADG